MGGFETTAVIRDPASPVRNHSIPIIALTASAMRGDQAKCLAAGMDDYLAKPLEVTELLAKLEKWMPPSTTLRAGFDSGLDSSTGSLHRSAHTAAQVISQSPEAGVPSREIFDRAVFVQRNLGDLDLSREVAAMFINCAPEYIESISTAMTARDAVALRQSAHKLRGAAANLALPLLSATAALIESQAVAGDLEKTGQLLTRLRLNFEQSLKVLTEVLLEA
jgi:CheY-like chemotaxis protein